MQTVFSKWLGGWGGTCRSSTRKQVGVGGWSRGNTQGKEIDLMHQAVPYPSEYRPSPCHPQLTPIFWGPLGSLAFRSRMGTYRGDMRAIHQPDVFTCKCQTPLHISQGCRQAQGQSQKWRMVVPSGVKEGSDLEGGPRGIPTCQQCFISQGRKHSGFGGIILQVFFKNLIKLTVMDLPLLQAVYPRCHVSTACLSAEEILERG